MATFVGEEHVVDGTEVPLVVNVPAGVQDGDVLIAGAFYFYTSDASSHPDPPPAGWTTIAYGDDGIIAAAMFYRVASSEPASYSWDFNFGDQHGVVQAAFRGIDTSGDPVAAFATSAQGVNSAPPSTVTCPSVTTFETTTILSFNATYRHNTSVVLHDSADAGVETADWGQVFLDTYSASASLYHKLDVDAGSYAYHIDLSGSGHDGRSTFTVALKGTGTTGDMAATAPAANVAATGGIVSSGDVAATAPFATAFFDALTDLVRCEIAATAPVAQAGVDAEATTQGPLGCTAPMAHASAKGHREIFVTIEVNAPIPRVLMGAETRIFGPRVVVVRPEPRVRYPF